MQKAITYIDILGFSNALNNSVDEAIMTLNSFNTIVSTSIGDLKASPIQSYPLQMQNLVKRTSVDSFLDFLPFSDSVFITSLDCNSFVMQLGHFALSSFQFNSDIYANANNPDDPTLTYALSMVVDSNGNPQVVKNNYHQPPVLFRGGIAWGDVVNLKPFAMVNGTLQTIDTLTGKALVNAVKIGEMKIKGPRLMFGEDVYSHLTPVTKNYCRPLPEDKKYYEILWPAMGLVIENNGRQEFYHFIEIFEAAYNLWQPFNKCNNVAVEEHYIAFMNLIIDSTIRIYDTIWNDKAFAIGRISMVLDEKGIKSMFSHLLQ